MSDGDTSTSLGWLFSGLVSGAIAAGGVVFYLWRRPLEREDREHGVRFEALHTERVRIVGEMYRLLSVAAGKLEWAIDIQISDMDVSKRVHQDWSPTANAFFDYYDQHRIWVPEKTCKVIDHVWEILKQAGYLAADSTVEHKSVLRSQARTFLNVEFKSARAELDSEVRRLLESIEDQAR